MAIEMEKYGERNKRRLERQDLGYPSPLGMNNRE